MPKRGNEEQPGKNLRIFGVVLVVVGGCALFAAITGTDAQGARPVWAVLGVLFVLTGLLTVRARVPESLRAANRIGPIKNFTVIDFVVTSSPATLRRGILSRIFGPDTAQIAAWLWTAGAIVSAVAASAVPDRGWLGLAILFAVVGLAFIAVGATGGASVDTNAIRWRERLPKTALWSEVVRLELAGGSVWRYLLDLPGYGPHKRAVRVITSGGRPLAIASFTNAGPVNERDFVRAVLGQAQIQGVAVVVTDLAAWASVLGEVAPSLLHD